MKLKFNIVKDSSKSLRERCKEVPEPISEEYIQLVNDMTEYLKMSQDEEISKKCHIREGVGLAAPQIGKNIRALVVYYPYVDEDGNEQYIDHRLINPKVLVESVKMAYLEGGEGCLSVDNPHEGYVYRHFKIVVEAFDAKQLKKTTITARGYEAIVLQHELDHLNGVLFYDHIDKKDPFKEIPGSVRF